MHWDIYICIIIKIEYNLVHFNSTIERIYKSEENLTFIKNINVFFVVIKILIDGPYGAPSQHIFEAEHAVLIAAGIGITPFASILQSIMCQYRNLRHKCPNCDYIWDSPHTAGSFVRKVGNKTVDFSHRSIDSYFQVDFIWVTREQRSLEWFISLLARMEIEQEHLRQNSDKGLLLNVHLYVTSAKSAADLNALNVYLSLDLIGRENTGNVDAIDRIRQRTKHGRPNWDQVNKSRLLFIESFLINRL